MTFVHENEIAPFERLHGDADSAASLLLHQLGDFDDLHQIRVARPKAACVQVEAPRRDT